MKRMLVALMLMAAVPAFAGGRHLAAELGLDAAATAKLRDTFLKHRDQMMALRKTSWETRQALEQQLASERPDQRQVVQLTDQLTRNRQEMHTIRAKQMAELKQQLTPEQYARLILSRHHRGHHGKRHHDSAQ
jgi:Spy/CpxP family protein refolding chaperone